MGPSQVGMPTSHENFTVKRWQVVVIVEGIEPTTSATLQSRHSYLVTWSDPDFWKPKTDGLDGKRPWDERAGFFRISGSEKKVLVFDESLQVYMILCRRNGGFQRFCTFQCDTIIVFFDDILLNHQISRNHVRATCQFFRPQCLQWSLHLVNSMHPTEHDLPNC